MSYACHEEHRENDVTRAALPSHRLSAHSGLRAGASPERRVGDRGCPNPCRRDDRPVDCKTQSVRRRLAEELGCCGCTKPETSCLVTEDTSTCCRRRPAAPSGCSEPNANAAATAAYVDPVDQIINEGLMQQKKSSRRRSSACCSSRPSGRERRTRPSTANNLSYQPDFFDDQADMNNWQQHREREKHDVSRGRPSSSVVQAPGSNRLAFEPYVDNEPYSPAVVGTPNAIQPALQDENDSHRRQNMQRELERLNEQRSYLVECLERETKIIELMREYKQLKRAYAQQPQQQPSADDRERLQRLIDEEKRKLAEFQRRPRQQAVAPSGTYEIPSDSPTRSPTPSPARNRESACAAASSPPRQRRRLIYQPPSPDTDTEDECRAPPPRRRLLVVRPPSPSDSSDGGGDVNECGRRTPAATSRCPADTSGTSRDQESSRRPHSSLQDSFMYYYRAIRNGVPPVTADVPQQTSSTWSTCGR
ncbi:hypothetical protein ACI65C_012733 [Semiaphis heraclei]